MRVLRPSTTQASSEPMTAFPMPAHVAAMPAELPGVAHEHHRREIGSAIGEGCQPGPDGAPSQDEAVDVRGVLAAVEADGDQYREIEDQ